MSPREPSPRKTLSSWKRRGGGSLTAWLGPETQARKEDETTRKEKLNLASGSPVLIRQLTLSFLSAAPTRAIFQKQWTPRHYEGAWKDGEACACVVQLCVWIFGFRVSMYITH